MTGSPTVIVRPHPQAAAASPPANPPPAPAAPGTIPNYDKMSFAQKREAQDRIAQQQRNSR
jgi:hypothetical protein